MLPQTCLLFRGWSPNWDAKGWWAPARRQPAVCPEAIWLRGRGYQATAKSRTGCICQSKAGWGEDGFEDKPKVFWLYRQVWGVPGSAMSMGDGVSPNQRAGNPENSILEETIHSFSFLSCWPPVLMLGRCHSTQATPTSCAVLTTQGKAGCRGSALQWDSMRPSYPTMAQEKKVMVTKICHGGNRERKRAKRGWGQQEGNARLSSINSGWQA